MRRAGFKGRAGRVLAKVSEGRAHYMRVVEYAFATHLDSYISTPSGKAAIAAPFVELWETHRGGRGARIVPLSELVHLVQNVGSDEFWQIAARRRPNT